MPPCAAARTKLDLRRCNFVFRKANSVLVSPYFSRSALSIQVFHLPAFSLLHSLLVLSTFLLLSSSLVLVTLCQQPAQAQKPERIKGRGPEKKEQDKKDQDKKEDEAKVKVWKVHQTGDVLGERFLYIGADSFKAFYPKARYAISASAPDWKIHFYNIDRRTIFSTTIESFNKRLSLRARANAQSFYPYKYKIVPGKPKLIAGEKTYCLTCQSTEPPNKDSVKRSDFYLAERIALPPRMQEFFKPTWGAPMCKNQPLRIDLELGDGRRSNKLDTTRIVLELLPRKFFEPPTGYKKTESEEEVLIGDGIINDIIGDLGKRLGSNEKERRRR